MSRERSTKGKGGEPFPFDPIEEIVSMRIPMGKRSKEEAWGALFTSLEKPQEKVIPQRKFASFQRWAIAASIALLLSVLGYWYMTRAVVVESGIAQLQRVTLPDGSSVSLNAESRLWYRKFGWGRNRTVHLEGEGLFSVSKGKQFIVIVDGYTVAVRGTVFNVRLRERMLNVSCYEGEVAVSAANAPPVPVGAGQCVSLALGNEVPIPTVATDSRESNWTSGDFYFRGAPLLDVLDELQRQFSISISLNFQMDNRFYSGYFSRTSLNDALDMVCIPMGLSWEISPDSTTVHISSSSGAEPAP